MHSIEQAAQQLHNAETEKKPCPPIRELIGKTNLEDAYAVQQINTEKALANGARLIGRKIGLTSKKVQEQLGVDQPDYGALLNTMKVKNKGTLHIGKTMQPKAEAEIAFVLKSAIAQPNPSLAEVIQSIDYAVAAIEVVGSRIANWDITITDTIADNASASHFVLGDTRKKLTAIDVVACKMELLKNNQLVSEGTGAACLGSPLLATQWLAKKMVAMKQPLQAGDIVLSGALGPMTPVKEGDLLQASVSGLGTVQIQFSK